MKTLLNKFKPIFYLIRLYQTKHFSKNGFLPVLIFILSIFISILTGVGISFTFRLTHENLSNLFIAILTFQLVLGAGSLVNLLINESEHESLLVLPIPSGMVAIVKVIGILRTIYKYSFLFYITLLIGLSVKLNLYYGIIITLFIFLYSILSIVIFTFILLFLPKYLAIFRNKKIFNTIASFFPVLVYLLFNVGRTTILMPVLKFLSYLPINYLFSNTILIGNIFMIILSFTLGLIIIYLFYKNIDHLLSYILLSNHSKSKRKLTKFSYFKYELRLLFSNPGYITEIVFPSIFFSILISIQFFTLKLKLPNFTVSTAFGMLSSIMLINIGYLHTTSLSREAPQIESILSLPISGKYLFISKLISNYIISIITSIPLILFILYSNFNLNSLGFIVGLVANLFIVSGFSIIRGFKNPCFSFTNIKDLTKATSSFIQLLYVISAIGSSILIYIVPHVEYIVFIYFVTSSIFFYINYKKIDQIYQEVYLS